MEIFSFAGIVSRPPKVVDTRGENKLVVIPVQLSKRVKKGDKYEYVSKYIDVLKSLKAESAEKFAAIFSPGDYVAGHGEVKVDAYKDKDGEAKASLSVWVDDISKQGSNPAYGSSESGKEKASAPQKPKRETKAEEAEEFSDDLPF